MEAKVKQTFEELTKIPENTLCFECGETTGQYASVNNGIFLCDKCAIKHKDFGPNVSSIRSTTSDPWSEVHLNMMVNGGNSRLKEYFEKYYIPRDGPMDFKYRTHAGIHYRKLLRAVCANTFLPEPLDPSIALQMDETLNPNEVPEDEVGFEAKTEVREENNMDKMNNYLKKAYETTVQKTKESGKAMSDVFHDPQLRENISNSMEGMKKGMVDMSNVVVAETKNLGNKINEKLNDPNFKEGVKEVGRKISTEVRKSWLSTVEFFKGFADLGDKQKNDDRFETVYSAEPHSGESLLKMPEPLQTEKKEEATEVKKEVIAAEAPAVENKKEESKTEEITSLD